MSSTKFLTARIPYNDITAMQEVRKLEQLIDTADRDIDSVAMRITSPDDETEPTTPADVDTQDEKTQTLHDVEIDKQRNGKTTNATSVPPMQEANDLKNRISENPDTKDDSEAPEEANEATSAAKNPHTDSATQEKESAFDWMVLLCAFGSNVTFGMDFNSFSVFYPFLMEYFEATSAQVGWCHSIEAFVTSIFSIFSSRPIEIYGCRRPGVIGSFIFCLGIALTSLAPNLSVVYLTYGIIAGFGASICGLTSSIIVQQRFQRNRGLVNGVAVVGFSLGGFVGPAVATILIKYHSWRGAYLILAAIYAHRIAFALLFVTPSRYLAERTNKTMSSDRTVKDSILSIAEYLRKTFDFSILRKKKLFTLFTFVLCVHIVIVTGYIQHCVSRAIHIGIPGELAFWASSLVGIANTVSRIAVSVIGNLSCINRCLLFAFGLFVSVVSVIVLLLSPNLVGIMASAIIFGFTLGCTGTIHVVIAVDLVGVELLTRCLAVQAFIFGFFRLTAAPFIGWIYDATRDYNVPFALLGCLGFVDGWIMLLVFVLQRRQKRKKKKKKTEEVPLEEETDRRDRKRPKQLPVVAVSASNHELSHC